MKVFLRGHLALLGLVAIGLINQARAQGLHLSSIEIPRQGIVRLSLTGSASGSVHVEASTDLKTWAEVTNTAPDANGAITLNDSPPVSGHEFFRVFTTSGGTTPTNLFIATVTELFGGPITNATVTIVGTNLNFRTDASGRASIPVADLSFDTGFRLRVDAPGFISQTTDLPPGIYNYTFELTAVEFAPPTLANRTYSLGASNFITLYDTGLFRLQTSNEISSGAYFAERSTTIDDTWSIKAAGTDQYAEIGLTFTSGKTGRFTNEINGLTASGDFTEAVFTNAPPIQPAPAPTAIKTIRFVTLDTPLGSGLDFTFELTGTTNGTFVVTGAFEGQGTFQYSRTTSGTTLRLDYTNEFTGDYDALTLNFIEGAGLNTKANTFSGTMSAGGNVGPVTGTFSYESAIR
jgi:hypothetical protein